MRAITVEFRSGYETEVEFDPNNLPEEYWVEVTQRQNPYDAADNPVAIIIDGRRIAIDNDGSWLVELDEHLMVEA